MKTIKIQSKRTEFTKHDKKFTEITKNYKTFTETTRKSQKSIKIERNRKNVYISTKKTIEIT